jgi:hypothetical protein
MLSDDDIERIADRIIAKLDERDRDHERRALAARMARLQTRLEQLTAPEQLTEVWRLRESLNPGGANPGGANPGGANPGGANPGGANAGGADE